MGLGEETNKEDKDEHEANDDDNEEDHDNDGDNADDVAVCCDLRPRSLRGIGSHKVT